MLATSMFVVLRLAPALAGATPLPLDGLELVALGVDLIALLCCALLWQTRIEVRDTVERVVNKAASDHGDAKRPDVDSSVR